MDLVYGKNYTVLIASTVITTIKRGLSIQSKEKRLISRFFQRLKQVEHRVDPRDSEVERQIQDFILQQPGCQPYYIRQSLLIQEAALNRLNQQIQQLKNEAAHL